MGISDRKLRDQEKIKQLIIEHSWSIVQCEGWQALSIRKIADSIEYSAPIIYKHFENKDAIGEYFTKEGFALLAEELGFVIKDEPKPDVQLKTLAACYWKFAFQNRKHYEVMFGLGIPKCEVVNNIKEMKAASDIMLLSISACLKENNMFDVDLYLKFKTFWSILHGIVSLELLSNTTTNQNEVSPILVDAVNGFIISLKHKNY